MLDTGWQQQLQPWPERRLTCPQIPAPLWESTNTVRSCRSGHDGSVPTPGQVRHGEIYAHAACSGIEVILVRPLPRLRELHFTALYPSNKHCWRSPVMELPLIPTSRSAVLLPQVWGMLPLSWLLAALSSCSLAGRLGGKVPLSSFEETSSWVRLAGRLGPSGPDSELLSRLRIWRLGS